MVIGPAFSTAIVGATLLTVSVWLSWALAGVFSSSCPLTLTVFTTDPALRAAAVVVLKERGAPGARIFVLMTRAAPRAAVRSPSTLSMTLVMVTGSVLAGLVFLMTNAYVALFPSLMSA